MPNPIEKNGKTCFNEWSRFSNCCELKSLIAYNKKDSDNISKALHQAFDSIYRISVYIQQTVQMKDFLLDNGFESSGCGLIRTFDEVYSKAKMKSFRETMNSIINNFKGLNKQGTKCWEKISNIRGLSLCSTCSGRSEVFFEKGAALIELSTCTEIIASCESHLLTLIKFIIRSTEFFSNVYEIGVKEEEINVILNRNLVEEITNYFKILNRLEIMSNVHQYLDSSSNSIEKKQALIKICETTTDLAQDAFIVKVLPILDKIEESSKDLRDNAVGWTERYSQEKNGKRNPDLIRTKLASKSQEPRPPRRLLFSTSNYPSQHLSINVEGAFRGDVIVGKFAEIGEHLSATDTSNDFFRHNQAMNINPQNNLFP